MNWNGVEWTGMNWNDTRMDPNDTGMNQNDSGMNRNDTEMNRNRQFLHMFKRTVLKKKTSFAYFLNPFGEG